MGILAPFHGYSAPDPDGRGRAGVPAAGEAGRPEAALSGLTGHAGPFPASVAPSHLPGLVTRDLEVPIVLYDPSEAFGSLKKKRISRHAVACHCSHVLMWTSIFT